MSVSPLSRRSVLAAPLLVAAAGAAAPAAVAAPGRPGAPVPEVLGQSPVDVRRSAVRRGRALPPLQVHYRRDVPVSLAYVTRDAGSPDGCSTRDVEETEQAGVRPGDGWVVLGGRRYDLLQTHFHTPSEHTVDGWHAPMEQHLVHADADGNLLVLAVLLVEGPAGEADRLLSVLPDECVDPVTVEHVDLRAMLPEQLGAVRYSGSLTTDPYTEGVRWFVLEPRTVSAEGVARFRTVFPDGDAREVQPLGRRELVADPSASRWLRRL